MDQDRKQFQDLVQNILRYPNGKKLIARRLGVARSSVQRWADGINYPHDAMIPSAIKELENLLDELK